MTWLLNNNFWIRPRWLFAGLLLMMASTSVQASFEPFIGRYEGIGVVGGGGEIKPRDISVSIESKGNGFRLKWTAVMHKAGGKTKRKAFSIDFLPSKRPGLYSSAMRKNLFGQPAPMDPLKGDPYVWCKVEGGAMTVHALLITEDGGYELQIYKRTLRDGGLDLEYQRVRDNEVLRKVTGELTRVE